MVDTQHIRKAHRALSAAWRRWEEEGYQDAQSLRETVRATKHQVETWGTRGEYLVSNEARLLQNEIAVIEAMMIQSQQEQDRGY